MLQKEVESRWTMSVLIFTIVYCGMLFLFRYLLVQLEINGGSILKPEPAQIIAIGLLIILYHFAFVGLYLFAHFGPWQKIVSLILSIIIISSLLYAMKELYKVIVNNPFLSFTSTGALPWYAQEKVKFLLANSPLIFFFITVFILRFLMLAKPSLHAERN